MPAHIEVHDENMYWSTVGDDRISGSVFNYFMEKDIVEPVVSGYDFTRGFQVDLDNIYWIDGEGRAVMSADRFTGDTTVLVTRQYEGSSLVLDRGNVYYATQSDGLLQRVDKATTLEDRASFVLKARKIMNDKQLDNNSEKICGALQKELEDQKARRTQKQKGGAEDEMSKDRKVKTELNKKEDNEDKIGEKSKDDQKET